MPVRPATEVALPRLTAGEPPLEVGGVCAGQATQVMASCASVGTIPHCPVAKFQESEPWAPVLLLGPATSGIIFKYIWARMREGVKM